MNNTEKVSGKKFGGKEEETVTEEVMFRPTKSLSIAARACSNRTLKRSAKMMWDKKKKAVSKKVS